MKRLLAPLDLSDESSSLIRFLFPFAGKHGLHHIDFIHVEEEEDFDLPETLPEEENTMEKVRTFVDRTIAPLSQGGISFNVLFFRGLAEEEILKRIKEMNYDMIVMGHRMATRIDGFLGEALGTRVIDHVSCPVLVFNPRKTKWMMEY